MAIVTIQTPPLISAVYSDNKFQFFETGAAYFTLVFSGDVSGTFKIFPNSSGVAEFNARYFFENYIYSQIALPNWTTLPDGMKTYSLSVTSDLASVKTFTSYKFFNAAKQDSESTTFTSGDVLNNTDGGINIHRDDELTLQMISGSDIGNINAGTAVQGVPSNVYDYIVAGVNIHILEKDPRFEPYRFAFVNQNGATDYINFSLADSESLKIDRDFYENDNKNKIYNVDVEQEITVVSEMLNEQQSANLKYFWFSPKVELIKGSTHYPVNLLAKSVKVLKREAGLISYSVKFTHESNYNVQK